MYFTEIKAIPKVNGVRKIDFGDMFETFREWQSDPTLKVFGNTLMSIFFEQPLQIVFVRSTDDFDIEVPEYIVNNDQIFLGNGDDRVKSGGGDDYVNGGGGNDVVWGGDGNDLVKASSGHDHVWGGGGNDHITGGRGHDFVWGGEGNDLIRTDVDFFNTYWFNEFGDDQAYGGAGNDRIFTGLGNDVAHGGDGDDFIHTGLYHLHVQFGEDYDPDGNDLAYGGDGDDRISTGEGSDIIFGGDGDDVIDAGPRGTDGEEVNNTDIAYGGGGADTFFLNGTTSSDLLNSFARYRDAASEAEGFDVGEILTETLTTHGGKIAGAAVKAGLTAVGAGIVGDLGSALVGGLIDTILKQSDPFQATEDVVTVMDFNPLEDLLVIPADHGADVRIETATVSADNYLEFSFAGGLNAGKAFARAQIGDDFWQAFEDSGREVGSDGARSEVQDDILDSLIHSRVRIDGAGFSSGDQPNANAVDGAGDAAFELNANELTLFDQYFSFDAGPAAITNTLVLIGAAGGMISSSANDNNSGLAIGTHFDDAITANTSFFDPNADDAVLLRSSTAELHGFDGDDLLIGGREADLLFGGDGDDVLYGMGSGTDSTNNGGELVVGAQDRLFGGAGDDIAYRNHWTGKLDFDGGTGIDTIDFTGKQTGISLTAFGLEATGDDAGDNDTDYTISRTEVFVGSDHDDTFDFTWGRTEDFTHDRFGRPGDGGYSRDGFKISAGAGNDRIDDSHSQDYIDGGQGDDQINLNTNSRDILVFELGDGNDTVSINSHGARPVYLEIDLAGSGAVASNVDDFWHYDQAESTLYYGQHADNAALRDTGDSIHFDGLTPTLLQDHLDFSF